MTTRIAEAGEVWMEWDEAYDCFFIHNDSLDGLTIGGCATYLHPHDREVFGWWYGGWDKAGLPQLERDATISDVVCLLWSLATKGL